MGIFTLPGKKVNRKNAGLHAALLPLKGAYPAMLLP
jgi:hypothetical protein